MNIAQIESNVKDVLSSFSKETFVYDFLTAYGLPKSSITRLRKGNLNLSKVDGEISWKKRLFFKEVTDNPLAAFAQLNGELKHKQRFVIVTDYETLLAKDTKTGDPLDISFRDLVKHCHFFLPWAGMEKKQQPLENEADIKAAGRMAKLFDEIKKDNPDDSPEFTHGLNVFLSRLLFCFFAEDTGIFDKNQFTNAISSHTQADGSDLHTYLDRLFEVMNTKEADREDLPNYLDEFPYVNGGLFGTHYQAPVFTRTSRQAIIESGELNWSAINPDIFGSMIQAVVSPEHRGGLGMHYTSVPNIMKVIEPLFLNGLREAFEKARILKKPTDRKARLNQLRQRLASLKIFDPACGSGNFLIIAYKRLRELEIEILKELKVMQGNLGSGNLAIGNEYLSSIFLTQFYGIEIDDFAHEIAMLSLWLAEHQMNVAFKAEFGRTKSTLPLKEAGNIICGNATRLDWEEVCPKEKENEIYVLGNPPYRGASIQSSSDKEDMSLVFKGVKGYKNLDYIACWFYKASIYIAKHNAQLAFVSTNSICQGEQVALLWSDILNRKLEISFAYPSFKWANNARGNAGVTVAIIGVRNISESPKYVFKDNMLQVAHNVNPYLLVGGNRIIVKRAKLLSNLPPMDYGSKAVDGGNLILNSDEKEKLLQKDTRASTFVKKFTGSKEFINEIPRYCIWISKEGLPKANKIEAIRQRIEAVRRMRLASNKKATREDAEYPYRFGEVRHQDSNSIIIVPSVSSERREYIPIGFLDNNFIVSNSALALYEAYPFAFGLLTSKMHMAWVKTFAGRLKSDYRYSSVLCYNTFPFPPISEQRKDEITQCVFRILDEREKHSERTLAQLYDPDKMPAGLREAHQENDRAVERCYRNRPFASDEDRLEYLFRLYEKMIVEEKEKNTLFEKSKKTRRKKAK